MSTALTISLVTPTLNSAQYLSDAFESIHTQEGPFNLQHVVVDGGSTDTTLDIVQKYAGNIDHWESGPDGGMYDALSKGFESTSGEVMGWLNGDDVYFPWTLSTVASIFQALPEVEWLSTLNPVVINEAGQIQSIRHIAGFSSKAFADGVYVGFDGLGNAYASDFIQQESTFWRRGLWERLGTDPLAHFRSDRRQAGDFGLWALFAAETELYGIDTPLAGWRRHGSQFTDADPYMAEVQRSLDILRTDTGYSGSEKAAGDFIEYAGNYVTPDSEHGWRAEQRPFYILQKSDIKSAVAQGVIF